LSGMEATPTQNAEKKHLRRPAPLVLGGDISVHKPTPPMIAKRPNSGGRRSCGPSTASAVVSPSDAFWAIESDTESEQQSEKADEPPTVQQKEQEHSQGSQRGAHATEVPSATQEAHSLDRHQYLGSPLDRQQLSPQEKERAREYIHATLALEEPWWVAPLRERAASEIQRWHRGNTARWTVRRLLHMDSERRREEILAAAARRANLDKARQGALRSLHHSVCSMMPQRVEEAEASTAIQSCFRGWVGRRGLIPMRAERAQGTAKRNRWAHTQPSFNACSLLLTLATLL